MRIKLLNLPDCYLWSMVNHTYEIQYPSVPSGLPVVTGLLREQGFKVEQDDLNVKLFRANTDPRHKSIPIAPLIDRQRVSSYRKMEEDPELEEIGERVLSLTRTRRYDLIAFSASDHVGIGTNILLHLMARILKKKHNPVIMAGGRIPASIFSNLLQRKAIDFACPSSLLYPGHSTILTLCHSLEEGNIPSDVPGLSYLRRGTMHMPDVAREQEQFPLPDFKGLPLEMYRRNSPMECQGRRLKDDLLVLPLTFVRGCQFSCAFCSQSREASWYAQDPEEVAAAVSTLSRRHRTKCFYFLNSSVNPTKQYAKDLSEALIRQDTDILWTDCANFSNSDAGLIGQLSRAGAARLIFGIESASPRLLRFIRKPLDISHAERMLLETSRHRIWTELDFIAGLPTESEEDITLSIEFLRRNYDHVEMYDLFKFWPDGDFMIHPGSYGLQVIEADGARMVVPATGGKQQASPAALLASAAQKIESSYERLRDGCEGKNDSRSSLLTFPFRSDDHFRFICHLTSYVYQGKHEGQ